MKKIAFIVVAAALGLGCKGTGGSSDEGSQIGTGSFDGTVKSSTHPNVKVGSACNGTLTMRGSQKPASISVKCDGVVVYEGDGVARNEVNDRSNPDDDTFSFTDDKTSDVDQTPAASMVAQEGKADGDSGILSIHDVEAGNVPAFEMTISL